MNCSDIISEEGGAEKGDVYNPVRGNKVIAFCREFLDESVPLASGSHHDSTKYAVENGKLVVTLRNGEKVGLKDEEKFVGYQGDESAPRSILLKNNGLHIDIQIDPNHPVGKT